eukprot:TCALIF_08752-PA protein Name:"Protein of unknown function" AED:0.51 eAED:0.93 QI:0/0/0/1/0/0/2/0/92
MQVRGTGEFGGHPAEINILVKKMRLFATRSTAKSEQHPGHRMGVPLPLPIPLKPFESLDSRPAGQCICNTSGEEGCPRRKDELAGNQQRCGN